MILRIVQFDSNFVKNLIASAIPWDQVVRDQSQKSSFNDVVKIGRDEDIFGIGLGFALWSPKNIFFSLISLLSSIFNLVENCLLLISGVFNQNCGSTENYEMNEIPFNLHVSIILPTSSI